MQKILVALNAFDPDKNALDFACYLGRLTRSNISASFITGHSLAVDGGWLAQ